ncbi:MAG: hypothetical protein V1897_14705 [Pseudomonadota bacterium]
MIACRNFILVIVVLILMTGPTPGSDKTAVIEAFSQTATAYANDSFLLLGMVGDQFVSGIFSKESAIRTVSGVQKRIRIIRSKINMARGIAKTEQEQKWLKMLDGIYVCLDQQAWTLSKYLHENIPVNAKRFDELRNNCIEKLNILEQYYASLGSPDELPAPLSTR